MSRAEPGVNKLKFKVNASSVAGDHQNDWDKPVKLRIFQLLLKMHFGDTFARL